jgi:hypothetical protein
VGDIMGTCAPPAASAAITEASEQAVPIIALIPVPSNAVCITLDSHQSCGRITSRVPVRDTQSPAW